MAEKEQYPLVWVWKGEGASVHPSAVFADRRTAHQWITRHELQGVLTAYPVGISVYDWAIEEGFFKPESKEQKSAEFIQNFSTECLDHYHYVLDEEEPDNYFLFPNPDWD